MEDPPGHGLTVFELFEAAEGMIEARLRRDDPAVTREQIDAAVSEWSTGGDGRLDADGYLREIPVPARMR